MTSARPRAPEELVRPEAANALRGPSEELEQTVRIIPPLSWAALIALLLAIGGAIAWGVFGEVDTVAGGPAIVLPEAGLKRIEAKETATVREVPVAARGTFDANEPLVTLKSPSGGKSAISSPAPGRVVEVLVEEGEKVEPGKLLLTTEPLGTAKSVTALVPAAEAKRVRRGMTAHVSPSTAPEETYGSVLGAVTFVSEYPITAQRVRLLTGTPADESGDETEFGNLADLGPSLEVRVALERDGSTRSGLRWTQGDGPPFTIGNGTPADVSVIVETQRPIERLFD